jgi:hypothetical protein
MSISQYVGVMEADSLRYARIIRERHIQGD